MATLLGIRNGSAQRGKRGGRGGRGGRGRGRGGRGGGEPSELPLAKMHQEPIRVDKKPEAEGRKGNLALDVPRPLWEKGPNLQFKEYKESLLQKGEPVEEIKELPPLRFMEGKDSEDDQDQDSMVMASYPRSGNTLLRGYLERIMGLVTGSDCDITKKLNLELMDMGLAGEGLVDKRVWIIKTHYPERYGKTKFGTERIILLVRNPLDCMTSLFHMVCSGSHELSIEDDDFKKFESHWTEFILQELTVWKDFHDFWLKASIPVHIIRYEDIVSTPKYAMTELLKFVLNVESLAGTRLEKYIELGTAIESPHIYKPRKGFIGKNSDKFTEETMALGKDMIGDILKKFDYERLFVKDLTELPTPDLEWIEKRNAENLKKSMYDLYENDNITSIMINFPELLLRKKSTLYPNGRTSYKFKDALRKKVTIVGKKMVSSKPSEADQPEVDDDEEAKTTRKKKPAKPLMAMDGSMTNMTGFNDPALNLGWF